MERSFPGKSVKSDRSKVVPIFGGGLNVMFRPEILLVVALSLACNGRVQAETAALEPASVGEQEAYAERFLEFLADIEQRYFARAQALNGIDDVTIEEFSFNHADYETKTIRGPVVEKMGRLLTNGKKPVFSFQKPTEFSRHMVIDVHPKSPLVGTLHMTILFQYEADGTSALISWFDILSGANRNEDLLALQHTMSTLFAEYDRDIEPFRKRLCGGAGSQIHRARRKSDCAGLSFQGLPMIEMNEDNFSLITKSVDRFLDTYFNIVEKRRDDKFSASDVLAQESMRRDYFQFNLTSDLFFSNGYPPLEVWSLVVAPPVVKF